MFVYMKCLVFIHKGKSVIYVGLHSEKVNKTMFEKYSTLFFCENLVDINNERLHDATLNPHRHAWIFVRLLIASVYGKQHLSDFVLLPDFHCK